LMLSKQDIAVCPRVIEMLKLELWEKFENSLSFWRKRIKSGLDHLHGKPSNAKSYALDKSAVAGLADFKFACLLSVARIVA